MNDSDLSVLRERAENGDNDAADELIELATERGDLDELRRLSDKGNSTATDQLIELAAERGDLDELRRLSDKGSATATSSSNWPLSRATSTSCDASRTRAVPPRPTSSMN